MKTKTKTKRCETSERTIFISCFVVTRLFRCLASCRMSVVENACVAIETCLRLCASSTQTKCAHAPKIQLDFNVQWFEIRFDSFVGSFSFALDIAYLLFYFVSWQQYFFVHITCHVCVWSNEHFEPFDNSFYSSAHFPSWFQWQTLRLIATWISETQMYRVKSQKNWMSEESVSCFVRTNAHTDWHRADLMIYFVGFFSRRCWSWVEWIFYHRCHSAFTQSFTTSKKKEAKWIKPKTKTENIISIHSTDLSQRTYRQQFLLILLFKTEYVSAAGNALWLNWNDKIRLVFFSSFTLFITYDLLAKEQVAIDVVIWVCVYQTT